MGHLSEDLGFVSRHLCQIIGNGQRSTLNRNARRGKSVMHLIQWLKCVYFKWKSLKNSYRLDDPSLRASNMSLVVYVFAFHHLLRLGFITSSSGC